jgi:hypothetical protein
MSYLAYGLIAANIIMWLLTGYTHGKRMFNLGWQEGYIEAIGMQKPKRRDELGRFKAEDAPKPQHWRAIK